MLRPLIRPIVRPLVRGVTEPGYGSLAGQIMALFASGEQGAWYDPSDLSSMNTKHDGSGAVPGVGDPVGYIADKSGRGNHAKQTTDTARPTLQADANGRYYLQFDGVDDSMITSAFLGGASDHLIAVGVGFLGSATAWQSVVEWSASPANVAGFVGIGRSNTTANATARLDTAGSPATGYNQPVTETGGLSFNGANHVLSFSARASANQRRLRVDGATASSNGLVGPLPDFSAMSRPMRIAKGATSGYAGYANIRLYSLIVMFAPTAISQAQIEAAERYVNSKTGAY